METKKCKRCDEIKDISHFTKKASNRDGYCNSCRECESIRKKNEYARPEIKEHKKYYQIKRLYGLTKNEYLNKLEQQNHQCVICTTKLLNDKNTHVDHCHKTGKIRDILCSDCNHILGILENNIPYLNNIANYLNVHKSVHI